MPTFVPSASSKPVILTTLTGGGFSFETAQILKSLPVEVRLIVVHTKWGGDPPDSHEAISSHLVPDFATRERRSILYSINAAAVTFFKSMILLLTKRIDCVLVVGSSHFVPVLLASTILLKKRIFIETITRVPRLSVTGLIVYKLRLSSVFLVQWPGLQVDYPRSQLGTLL